MAEESKVSETITAVKGLVEAVPVYQDGLQPAVKELGKGLHVAARCVTAALAPVSALVWGFDRIQEFVTNRVAEKLSGTAPENIVPPRPEVAGPALEALRYSGHDESLRELFANLLATSMDASTAINAHPGFVEILKNLSPDEALVMRFFAQTEQIPVTDVRAKLKDKLNEWQTVVVNFSHLGRLAGCKHPSLVRVYIDNLCRLQLLEIDSMSKIAAPDAYKELEEDKALEPLRQKVEAAGRTVEFAPKRLSRTAWGLLFCNACVLDKSRA